MIVIFLLPKKGCVAHIVRLIDYQVNTKIDPPGVDFAKALIFSQTNNVCNAPFFFIILACRKGQHL